MSQYPKWIYHKSEKAKIVKSKEEHDAHGPEWKESPADFEAKEVKHVESKSEEVKVEEILPEEEPKKKGKYK